MPPDLSTTANASLITALLPVGQEWPHGQFWSIEESAGLSYWRMLQSENMAVHAAEFAAAQEMHRATLAAQEVQAAGGKAKQAAAYKPYLVEDSVAFLSLSGPMTKNPTSWSSGASTVLMRRLIRLAANDPDVQCILLRVDSPGGSVSGTGDLAGDVAMAVSKKPVYAYVEDCCCSAAYWVASQCTAIIANPTAIVGSIGTIMVLEDTSRQAANQGVSVHVFATGAYKGAGTDGVALTQEQATYFQSMVDSLNAHFIAAVQSGRKMNDAQMAALTDARVHIGTAAQGMGLVDGIASLDTTVSQLKQLAAQSGKTRPGSGKEKMKMRLNLAGALSRIGLLSVAAAVAGAKDDEDETVAAALASQIDAEAEARVKAHPVLGACAAAGITTVAQFEETKQRADWGDKYVAALREDAKAKAVVAFGVTTAEGKKAVDDATAMIDAVGPDVLKATIGQYETLAQQKGLVGANGRSPGRLSAATPLPKPPEAVEATGAGEPAALDYNEVYGKYGPKK